MKKGRPSEG